MKRSSGVTAAAAVEILGSICVAAGGLLAFYGLGLQHQLNSSSVPPPHVATLSRIAVLGICIPFATLGMATGIGMTRLQKWARLSTLIFGGLLAVYSFIFIPLVWFLPLPTTAGVDAPSPQNAHLVMVSFMCVLLGIAIWWLVLLSRNRVAEQFLGAGIHAERPDGITVIAWLFVIPSLLNLVLIFTTKSSWNTPAPFFWIAITGVAAKIAYSLDLSMSFLAGVGLLLNKVWGFWVAIALDVYALLRLGIFIVLNPIASERWQIFVASRPPGNLSTSHGVGLHWIFITGFFVTLCCVLVILAAKKQYLLLATRQVHRVA